MEQITFGKVTIFGFLGAIGGYITTLFGGFDVGLTTLVILMIADYVSGFVVAGVFKASKKSDTGALNSSAGWRGLCKKGMTLLIILIATRLDLAIGSDFIRDATIIAFMINEIVSIIENAGLMGVNVPNVLIKAIDILKKKEDEKNG